MGYYPAFKATSKEQTLAYPHYSDERWRNAQLIYGTQGKTDEGAYSDRLWQWNYEAAKRASEATKGMGRTAAMWEAWLSEYYQRPVVVRYILGGVNWSTGYDYYYVGFDYTATPPPHRKQN